MPSFLCSSSALLLAFGFLLSITKNIQTGILRLCFYFHFYFTMQRQFVCCPVPSRKTTLQSSWHRRYYRQLQTKNKKQGLTCAPRLLCPNKQPTTAPRSAPAPTSTTKLATTGDHTPRFSLLSSPRYFPSFFQSTCYLPAPTSRLFVNGSESYQAATYSTMQHQASAPLAGQSYEAAVWDLNQLQSTYQIIEQIKASGGRLNEYSISEFEAFLEKTGHQVDDLNSLNVIHVTGTKGKGSTCAFVNSILDKLSSVHEKRTQKPLKIGLYTSPHLIEVRERIQINGQPIAQEDFAKYFYQVYDSLKSKEPPLRKITAESPEMPMYFRFLTLLAYHTFLMEGVDVAIIEVGVGGQYDSTNAIRKPVVCGIASLGIDHQASLGTTIESIAWHKAGIIKDGVPVFTVDQLPSALAVIQKRAEERNAPMHVVHPLGVQNGQLDNIELGISGEHQRVNAALAAALCREWVRQTDFLDVDAGELDEAISAGLKAAHWPGRSQTFVSPRIPSLTWHVDGAHTVESMAACAKWFLQLRLSGSRCVLLFNAAHNRSANILLDTLSRDADGFCEAVFCPNISSRADSVNHTVQNDMELRPQKDAAQAWSQLTKVPNSKTTIMPSINDAVAHIEATYGDGAPVHVLATGSLHLVGGVLDFAKGSV